jgi:hypothetical protein
MAETITERLENMNPIGVDQDGNLLVKLEDWFWLREQVERVHELEINVGELREYNKKETNHIVHLLRANKQLHVVLSDLADHTLYPATADKARQAFKDVE